MGIALTGAWRELLQAVTTDATGEMLATGLRLERFAVKEVRAWMAGVTDRLKAAWPEWTPVTWEPAGFENIVLPDGLAPEDVSARQLLRKFRNAKAYFEGNGRHEMRAWLEGVLLAAASEYADKCAALLTERWTQRYESMLADAAAFVREQLLGFAAIYGGEDNATADWHGLAAEIGKLADQFQGMHAAAAGISPS